MHRVTTVAQTTEATMRMSVGLAADTLADPRIVPILPGPLIERSRTAPRRQT